VRFAHGGGWAAALMAVLLGACATLPRGIPTVEPAAIFAFQLDGRFQLKIQKEGYPGRVRWQHSERVDELWFYSPLGASVARLRQDESGALLVTADGEEYRAADLRQLALDVLGWDLPLDGLPYWVRGLTWPAGPPAQKEVDRDGRLEQLSQGGWRVSYLDWTPAGVAGLPSKLDLQGERLRMRLVVERWSVEKNVGATAQPRVGDAG